MPKKLIDQDPFSNGTEHMYFEEHNCDMCVKGSHARMDGTFSNSDKNNIPKCPIQRDIVIRMFSNDPINEETVEICRDFILEEKRCKHLQTERKKRNKKKYKNQIELF